jgi:hypothetical protein
MTMTKEKAIADIKKILRTVTCCTGKTMRLNSRRDNCEESWCIICHECGMLLQLVDGEIDEEFR